MKQIYIVVYRLKSGGKWSPQGSSAIFEGDDGLRLARNMAECLNASTTAYDHCVVEGIILPVSETEAEVNARLGDSSEVKTLAEDAH